MSVAHVRSRIAAAALVEQFQIAQGAGYLFGFLCACVRFSKSVEGVIQAVRVV